MTIRLGLIGTSWWADMMYVPSIRSHAGAELSAVCGSDTERTTAFAEQHDIPRSFTDWRQMIAGGGLDGLVISSPDDLHKEMALAALDSGLHVLCEKPLALNATDAALMLARAEATGRNHMVLFTWRWQPPFQFIRQLVDEGFVGKPYRAQFCFSHGGGHDQAYQWRLDGDRANGVLGDLGAHMIDMGRWLIGDVARVSAHAPCMIDRSGFGGRSPNPVNDTAHLTLEYANGAQGAVDVSTLEHLGEIGVQITAHIDGDAGSIDLDYQPIAPTQKMQVRGIRAGETERRILPIPQTYLAQRQPPAPFGIFSERSVGVRLFIDAIAGGFKSEPGFEDGLATQLVIDAALRSHKERRWIDL